VDQHASVRPINICITVIIIIVIVIIYYLLEQNIFNSPSFRTGDILNAFIRMQQPNL